LRNELLVNARLSVFVKPLAIRTALSISRVLRIELCARELRLAQTNYPASRAPIRESFRLPAASINERIPMRGSILERDFEIPRCYIVTSYGSRYYCGKHRKSARENLRSVSLHLSFSCWLMQKPLALYALIFVRQK